MSVTIFVSTVIAAVAGFTLFFAVYVLRNMFVPTRGKRIDCYPHPGKALLVMDIQESSTSKHIETPFPLNSPFGRMIVTVNHLIEHFDRSGYEVAYVRQVFSSNIISRLHGGRILAGRLEPRICRWIKVINRNDFAKNRTDAFSSKHLEKFLVNHQVEEIVLVGMDAAFCVYYTALGALNRGYRVTVVSDAVLTGRNFKRTLQRFRSKGITVTSSQELLQALNKKP